MSSQMVSGDLSHQRPNTWVDGPVELAPATPQLTPGPFLPDSRCFSNLPKCEAWALGFLQAGVPVLSPCILTAS